MFFFEKRTKKLLFPGCSNWAGHGQACGNSGEIKVFCFFSSEKKAVLK
jgi:hypothetical protein